MSTMEEEMWKVKLEQEFGEYWHCGVSENHREIQYTYLTISISIYIKFNVCLSVCLFVCLSVPTFLKPSFVRFWWNLHTSFISFMGRLCASGVQIGPPVRPQDQWQGWPKDSTGRPTKKFIKVCYNLLNNGVKVLRHFGYHWATRSATGPVPREATGHFIFWSRLLSDFDEICTQASYRSWDGDVLRASKLGHRFGHRTSDKGGQRTLPGAQQKIS